jgi:hypothetical protein
MSKLCIAVEEDEDITEGIEIFKNTKALEKIKSIIEKKIGPSTPLVLPPYASKHSLIPDSLEYFTQPSNILEDKDNNCNKQNENKVIKQYIFNNSYVYLKILMFAISMSGKYGVYFLKENPTKLNDKIIDKLCFLLFHTELDKTIESYHNKLINPDEDFIIKWVREYSVTEHYEIINDDGENREVIDSDRPSNYSSKQIKYSKISDIIRMDEKYESIKDFSISYGRYDAYSLTAYHDIEYYIDRFIYIILSNRANEIDSNEKIYFDLYPKCFHETDFPFSSKYNKTSDFNIYKYRFKSYESEFLRFIGLLIWDVKHSRKITVDNAVKSVKRWYEQNYGWAGVEISYDNMLNLYRITKRCIDRGRYLIRSNTGRYKEL